MPQKHRNTTCNIQRPTPTQWYNLKVSPEGEGFKPIAGTMKSYIRERKPDFQFGYNYGLNYEYAAAKSPDSFR